MKSAGLRNKPIDRRHLKKDERETYNASGDHGARTQALARTKAYRGQMAYAQNKPMKTVTTTPGTGGMNKGIGIQRQRKVNQAATNERTKGLRPDMGKKPNIYDKLDTSYE